MISRLHGLLIEKQPPLLVIDVQGVGYEVFAPMSTFYNLPEVNAEISLLIHFVVREDAHVLYGFLNESERMLFRDLIRVSGIGPKLALSILSSMELATFVNSIHHNDTARLKRIPGVGKKTAERLVVEMRDRLEKQRITPTTSSPPTSAPLTQGITSPVDDAISALIALGYKPADASHWVHAVAEEGLSSEVLIRRALQSAL
ncbi:MAG: Holliday junction branch migration protein RuvA [Gammaproteobacteria bacterium]|nr:MAG: Holliday junction branch migration protein RuvA [Gammaproteobacteria bacterium]RKZ42130.1 MAG: Holliday junction branch migration protein RuvA [Gammaproteobacteria bacterium]RKZ72956.1 MAG: Holliday junction branch migration protein RuvA [Gammaproteobacteria bacterium]